MAVLEPDRFLEDMTGRYARAYGEAISAMVVAMTRGNRPALADARSRLEKLTGETMATAEIFGASLLMRDAAKTYVAEGVALQADRSELLAFASTAASVGMGGVTFDEAVDDMIRRTPITLRRAAERTAQRVAELYSSHRVAAFAKSAEHSVTKRVQSLIAEAMREGSIVGPGGGILVGEADIGKGISMSVDQIREKTGEWSQAYSRMVYRTNVNTATTAGRFRQSQDPDVKAVLPAFQYSAVGDGDTRSNHAAADGIVLSVDNRAWNRMAPPNGYNCRCTVDAVSLPMLRRMGRLTESGDVREDRVPAAAGPDPGFRHGGRPDLFVVGL